MKTKLPSFPNQKLHPMIIRWLPRLRYRVIVIGLIGYLALCVALNYMVTHAFEDSLPNSPQKQFTIDTLANTLFHVELFLGVLFFPLIYFLIRNIELKLDFLTEALRLFDYSGFKETTRPQPDTLPWVLTDLESVLHAVLERVKKEVQHLQQQNNYFVDIVNHLPGAIVHVDEEGTCLFLSAVWYPLIRHTSPSSLQNQPFKNFIHPDYRNDYQKNIDTLLSGAQTQTTCHIKLNGPTPPRPVELQMVRYINTSGIVSVLIYVFDCTTSMHHEDILRHENRQLHQWLESLPLPLYVKNNSGQYLFFNPAWEKLTEVSRLQWVGKTAWDVFEPSIAQALWERERELLDKKNGLVEETDVYNESGETRRALIYRSPILDNGNPIGTLGLIAPLDQYAHHTTLQMRMDRAEQQDRQHTQMLAHLSHSIRTHLHNLSGLVDLMSSWLKSLALPHNNEYLGLIHSIANTILTTTKDINDILSFEQRTTLIEYELFNLENVLIECARHFSFQAESKQLELIVQVDSVLPERIKGDAQLLRRALDTLLHNAIKFTPDGMVELSAKLLVMELDEVCIRFTVRDTGIGIQDDQQAHIFEPFVQGDTAIARQQLGSSGLGLTVFSRLMQLVGASYQLSSQPGQGTTVTFDWTFPYLPKTNSVISEEVRHSTLLIVEDHTRTLQVISELASSHFSRILSTSTAQQAIVFLNEAIHSGHLIDAILIDGRLSDEDRSAPYRILETAIETGVPHRFIMLPVHAPFREHERYRQAQATTVLLKPLNRREFLNALATAASHHPSNESGHPATASALTESLPSSINTPSSLSILMATNDPINRKLTEGWIVQQGHRCIAISTQEELTSYYTSEQFSAVIIDLDVGRSGGTELLRLVNLQNHILNYQPPIVVMYSGKLEEYNIPSDTPIWGQIQKPVQQSVLISLLHALKLFSLSHPPLPLEETMHSSLNTINNSTKTLN